MELIRLNRKSEPPSVRSLRERAADSVIEAQNCDTSLRKKVAYFCMAKEAVCGLVVFAVFFLAATGYIPLIFILPTTIYAVVKVKGKNFDRVVESIFPKRE
jgi:hypothetical protein